MKKIKSLFQKYKLLWAGLLVAGITALALAWTGYNVIHTVNGQSQYLQVHDYYDENQVLTATDPHTGWYQTIKAGPDTPLYGIRLYFDTFDRVVRGTMHVDLLDTADQVLSSGVCDMTEILGKDFQAIVFDHPTFSEQDGTEYRLHIYYEPEKPEDVVGLLYGTGDMPKVELDANGIPVIEDPMQAVSANAANPNFPLIDPLKEKNVKATAAMQYVTNYSGGIGLPLFVPIAGLLFIAVLGGWWLIFCKKAKPHMSFAWFAVMLGLTYTIITPPMAAPDEYTHVAGAYSLANQMMGQPTAYMDYGSHGQEQYYLPMRACDAPYMLKKSGDIGVFAYKQILDHSGELHNDGAVTEIVSVVAPARIQPIQYLPQAIGMMLARLLGLGFYPMLILGRVCSVIVYTTLMTLAIKLTPIGKNLFYAAALLPMGLELAGSFSADTTVIEMAFLFTALCLKGVKEKKPMSIAFQAAILILAALLAPAKAIYIVLIGLCFFIKAENLGGKLRSRVYKLLVCAAAVASWLFTNFETLHYMMRSVDTERIRLAMVPAAVLIIVFAAAWYKWHDKALFRKITACAAVVVVAAIGVVGIWVLGNSGHTLTPEELAAGIQPNGESIYTFSIGYMISNLGPTIKLLINTVTQRLPVYLQGLVGALPGEPIVHHLEISWTLTILLVMVLLCASLRKQDEPVRLNVKMRWAFGFIVAGVALLMVAAALMWTPINAVTVFGIQGRYLLPVLPLLLLLIGENGAVCTKRDISRGVCAASGFVGSAVLLQSVLLFCGA